MQFQQLLDGEAGIAAKADDGDAVGAWRQRLAAEVGQFLERRGLCEVGLGSAAGASGREDVLCGHGVWGDGGGSP